MKRDIINWINEMPRGSRISIGVMFFFILTQGSAIVALWMYSKSTNERTMQLSSELNARIDSLHGQYTERIRINDDKWFARLEECEKRKYKNVTERQEAALPTSTQLKDYEDKKNKKKI